MSRIRKLAKAEHDAYLRSRRASADAIVYAIDNTGQLDGDPVHAKLCRRAAAYRVQWLAVARKLEEAEEREGMVTR